MGWVITVAIIALTLLIPISFRCRYSCDGLHLWLCVGFLRIPISLKRERRKKKPVTDKQSAQSRNGKQNKSGGSIREFSPLLRILLDFLKDFRRKVIVRQLELRITLAGDDPCDLAVNYGKAWAGVGNLIPLLEQFIRIKKRDVSVFCDFTATESAIYAFLEIGMSTGSFLWRLVRYGILAGREYYKIMNQRKGGARI